MKPYQDFRLVFGYLPEIDRRSKAAQKLGLLKRVAAVLNDDDVPYSQLYWDMVVTFVENLNHDSITFEIDVGDIADAPLVFTSLLTMREHVESPPREFGVPFSRATFFLRGKANAYIDTEPYACAGGPDPYHDSWTFSIYRATDEVTSLRDACYRVCRQHGLPILEEMQGLPAPERVPLWKRLVRWIIRP
jgi:hypothetical protein